MRLDKHLFSQGLASSRSKAVHLIKTGQIRVNGSICTKQSYNIKATDVVEAKAPFKYMSRAGYKMEATFTRHELNIKGLSILDIGALQEDSRTSSYRFGRSQSCWSGRRHGLRG